MVNHSCAGNALVSYSERGDLQLVVVRRVEKEEEITVNYLDPYIYRWSVQIILNPMELILSCISLNLLITSGARKTSSR